ncbi:hypothetical protein [Azospirillum largimobile]
MLQGSAISPIFLRRPAPPIRMPDPPPARLFSGSGTAPAP